jgi:hypothetical protein
LAGCVVEQYARRDRSIKFIGRGLLFTGDNEVGPVPQLAIGRDLRTSEVMLLFCDARWNVRHGSGGYVGIRAVKNRAEQLYPGISKAWVRTGYTRRQAKRQHGLDRKCSICSRYWFDVEYLVEAKKRKFVICDVCIREFHALISSDRHVRSRASSQRR